MPVTLLTPSPPPPRLFSLYPAGKPRPCTVLPTCLLQARTTSWCGVTPERRRGPSCAWLLSPPPSQPISGQRSSLSNFLKPLVPPPVSQRLPRWPPSQRKQTCITPSLALPSPASPRPATTTQKSCSSCPLPTSGCLLLVPQPHLSLYRVLTIRIKLSLSHLKTLKKNLSRHAYAARGLPGFSCPMLNSSKHSSTLTSTPTSCDSLVCFLFVSMAKQCSCGQPVIPRSGPALSTSGGSLWISPGGAAHGQLKTTSARSCATQGL